MDVMVADASNCVIRQLSRGHMTLAKAVQQVRTPRSNAQLLASSKNAGSKRASSRSKRRSVLTANKRKSQNKNNSIIHRNIKSVQNHNGNTKSKVASRIKKEPSQRQKSILTPRSKSKKSAKDGMGKTIGSILRKSYTSGISSTRGYLDDVKQILTAPPSRGNIVANGSDELDATPRSPSPRRSSNRRKSMGLLDRAWTHGKSSTKMFIDDIQDVITPSKQSSGPMEKERPSSSINSSVHSVNDTFEKALRTNVHERDVLEKKRERRRSVTEAQKSKPKINQAQHESNVRVSRRVTELSGKMHVKQASVRQFKRRPSSPHLAKTSAMQKKSSKLNRFAGLRELRRSKREIIEAKLTRERYRKFMLKKQHTQPKRILRKGGGRLSVNIHNASEMAVHEFHPSFSRRSTAVSDVLRFKS